MPTTRLMQFSPVGGREETVAEDGTRSVRPIRGFSSAHFLKLIEDRGHVGFWSSELNSGHPTVSVGLYRVLGIDPSIALRYEDLLNLIHPEDLQKSYDMRATLLSGLAIDREFRIIRPDGTLRWINNKAEVIVDGAGRPSRAVGVITDITDRYSARLAGEEGWAHYKVLMASMSVTELRSTPNGNILDWSGWFELTGQTEEEAASQGWLQCVHPEDRERVRESFNTSLRTGQTYVCDYRITGLDGRYSWFTAFSAPLFGMDGSIREWVGAIVNTRGRNAEQSPSSPQERVELQGSHVRAARALLNWTVEDLSREAGISVSSVSRLEAPGGSTVRNAVIQAVTKAFLDSGVKFTHHGTKAVSLHFDPESGLV